MKEAINSPYRNLVFRETFKDEATVRRNGGIPTNVIFNNGKALYNGISSRINYPFYLNNKPVYSFRFRVNITEFSGNKVLLDLRSTSGLGLVNFYSGSGVVTSSGSSAIYINGILNSQLTLNKDQEIVIIHPAVTQGTGNNPFVIGANNLNTSNARGSFDLLEIYKGALTVSEIINLYSDRWNTEVTGLNGQPKSNIVLNSGFDTDTIWIKKTGVSIENGTANFVNATSSDTLAQSNVVVEGRTYLITYTVSNYSTGNIRCRLGGSLSTLISSNGTFKAISTALNLAPGLLYFTTSSFTGSIDNVTVQEIQPKLIFDFNSTNGAMETNTSSELTPTNVDIVKNGIKYSARFKQTTSRINCGVDVIGTKSITACGWIYLYSYGGNAQSRILDNGPFILAVYQTTNRFILILSRNGALTWVSTDGSFPINKWRFFAVTSSSSGLTSGFVGDLRLPPTQTGGLNTNAGTPLPATTNLFIGNNSSLSRWFDGIIQTVQVYEGFLDLKDITQIWSKTRNYII